MPKTIGEILDKIFENDMYRTKINEKEKQDKLSSGSKDKGGDHSKTVHSDLDDVKKVPEIKHVIEKLNIIRSGKSLKDESVSIHFNEYFESLNDSEKIALYVFLKGIGQILAGDLEANQVADPGDVDVPIEIEKDDKVQKRSIKPTVLKIPDEPESNVSSSSSEEDTSSPIPVKPKKR